MINNKLIFLLAIFITLLIGMNLLGVKIIGIFGISVSVGIFMVPFTFLITDIVEEVYGKKVAKQFVYSGILALLILFIYASIFVKLPPHTRYIFNDEYVTIFSSSLRMTIASIIAFALAQTHDILTFEWLKKKTKGRALWLRNNISTMISQFIDTFLFMMIAFYGIAPKFTFGFILQLVIPYYLFKIAFAVIDTPFVYLGVKWLKPKDE